jgi:hypothetical protein
MSWTTRIEGLSLRFSPVEVLSGKRKSKGEGKGGDDRWVLGACLFASMRERKRVPLVWHGASSAGWRNTHRRLRLPVAQRAPV